MLGKTLQNENETLREQQNSPLVEAPAEPKVSLPENFSGDPEKFRGFLNQCCLLFMLCPHTFPTDQTKVGLICLFEESTPI